jgi:sirohydrochlorin ferrochelatase
MRDTRVRAVLLIGYGSVLPGIGTAMIRIASRISASGIAPIAAAGFIAGCRPRFSEAMESCIACGATEIVVQPYALVEDTPIRRDLRRLVQYAGEAHPNVSIRIARPIGDHPALAQIVIQRATEADYAAAHNMDSLPMLNAHEQIVQRPPTQLYQRRADGKGIELVEERWRPSHTEHPVGMLLIASGSAKPAWDWPINAAAEWVRLNTSYRAVGVGFRDQNEPSVDSAIAQLLAQDLHSLIIVPYMLQLTLADSEYLLALATDARERHPGMRILIADHLNYDRRLLAAIADRVGEVAGDLPRRRLAAI